MFTNFAVKYVKDHLHSNRRSIAEDAAITLPTTPAETKWGQHLTFSKMKVHREGTTSLDI